MKKKKILIVVIILIGLITTSAIGYYMVNMKNNKKNETEETPVTIENFNENNDKVTEDDIEEKESGDLEVPLEENVSNDKNINTINSNNKDNTNNKDNKKDTTSNSSKENDKVVNSSEKQEQSTTNESNSSPKEESNSEQVNTNTICSDTDQGWMNYIKNYKAVNKSTLIFATKDEAISYGEYAMNNYDYGYWFGSTAERYKGDNCVREFWTASLYAPRICTDSNGNLNPMTYLPATEKSKLISVFDFIESLGYDCSNERY